MISFENRTVLLGLVLALGPACSPDATDTASSSVVLDQLDCIGGQDCHIGFDYNVHSDPPLGKFKHFGNREGDRFIGRVNETDDRSQCLVFGPNIELVEPNHMVSIEAFIDYEAWECNPISGGCGWNDYFAGYKGDQKKYSDKTRKNGVGSFVVDLYAVGYGVVHESRQEIEVFLETGRQKVALNYKGHINSSVRSVEVRVCGLKSSGHTEFVGMTKCHSLGSGWETCPDLKWKPNILKVAIDNIAIRGLYRRVE